MIDTPHYITPEEAKDMCCPISMMGNPHMVWKSCLGKRCMAWRWQKIGRDFSKLDHNHSPTPVYSTTHGYCGMVRS